MLIFSGQSTLRKGWFMPASGYLRPLFVDWMQGQWMKMSFLMSSEFSMCWNTLKKMIL